jgi:hypothetical protein
MDSRRVDRASVLLLAAPMLSGVSRLAKAIGKLHCEIGSARVSFVWDPGATRTLWPNPRHHLERILRFASERCDVCNWGMYRYQAMRCLPQPWSRSPLR